MRIKKILNLATIIVILFSCKRQKKFEKTTITERPKTEKIVTKDSLEFYGEKFSGNYTIEVKGVSSEIEVEVYGLEKSGKATWIWAENNGKGGVIVDDKKEGTWKATKNSVTIDIMGKTEMISETYEMKNGKLTNTILPKRYLKKIKKSIFKK